MGGGGCPAPQHVRCLCPVQGQHAALASVGELIVDSVAGHICSAQCSLLEESSRKSTYSL